MLGLILRVGLIIGETRYLGWKLQENLATLHETDFGKVSVSAVDSGSARI